MRSKGMELTAVFQTADSLRLLPALMQGRGCLPCRRVLVPLVVGVAACLPALVRQWEWEESVPIVSRNEWRTWNATRNGPPGAGGIVDRNGSMPVLRMFLHLKACQPQLADRWEQDSLGVAFLVLCPIQRAPQWRSCDGWHANAWDATANASLPLGCNARNGRNAGMAAWEVRVLVPALNLPDGTDNYALDSEHAT